MDIWLNDHLYVRAYIAIVALFLTFYVAGVVLYRLVFSPLAKFPGPRLAAATRLYETYFQIVKGGIFTWHIDQLHERYGPVVRITPWEIHIKDPDYYSTVYAGPGKHRNKDPWFSFISFPQSIFSTNGHELHRARRKVITQFFKKNAVAAAEPLVHENTEALSKHFSSACEIQQPLELHTAFYSFTSDMLSQYAFGSELGFRYLNELKIPEIWKQNITSMFAFCRIIRHFPIISHSAHFFPRVAAWAVPDFGHVYRMEQDVKRRVRALVAQHEDNQRCNTTKVEFSTKDDSVDANSVIYKSVLANPEVPQSDKELTRLQDDAIFLMMAGTDAPSQAMSITLFHILNNPDVCQKVQAELISGIPDIASVPNMEQIEKLPYLSATIREGLRISSIVTTRLPRSAPDENLQYEDWQIPAGTLVSMSTYFILRDPEIFPEPTTFVPDRWLLPKDELRELEKYLIPASKGTLGCLGQNMAWVWLHIVLGTLLRRFELSLHETTERNVEMTRDNFIGQTDPGMNVIQVKVLKQLCS